MYYLLKIWLKKIKDYKNFVFKIEDNNKIDNLVFVNLSETDKIYFMKIIDSYDFDETYFHAKYSEYSIIIKISKSRKLMKLIVLFYEHVFYVDTYKSENIFKIEDVQKYIKDKENILLTIINMDISKTKILIEHLSVIRRNAITSTYYTIADNPETRHFSIKHLFDNDYLVKSEIFLKSSLDDLEKTEFRYSLGVQSLIGSECSDVFFQYKEFEYLFEKLKNSVKNEISIERTIKAKNNNNHECNEIEIVLYSENSKRCFRVLIRELNHDRITICFYEEFHGHNLNSRLLDIKKGSISNYHDLSKNIDDFILDRLIRVFLNKKDRLKFSIDHDDELSQEEFENIKSYINLINY